MEDVVTSSLRCISTVGIMNIVLHKPLGQSVYTTNSRVQHNTIPRGRMIFTTRPVNSSMTSPYPGMVRSMLPRGWKTFNARPVNSNSLQKFFLSPDGKRFRSLPTAKAWNSVIVRNPNNNNNRTELTENSKRRRKSMMEQNPFRNLLRTTLKKNYELMKAKTKSRI